VRYTRVFIIDIHEDIVTVACNGRAEQIQYNAA
jgi:hypothetical protein